MLHAERRAAAVLAPTGVRGQSGHVASIDAVTVRGLTKSYRGLAAVDGIDLDIHTGEVFALLGPNGAGKSTTVEILEGYRRKDAGEVSVLGVDPHQAGREWRTRIGIVLQTSAENAELTVREMVAHFARYYPAPRDPDEVIEAVGLTESAGRRTRALSGGQRRRLDVALGIVGRPELIFLDEPTTGFDPEARRAFWTPEVDDPGNALGLPTRHVRVPGGRRLLAARDRRGGADGLDDPRPRAVPAHLPVATSRRRLTSGRA